MDNIKIKINKNELLIKKGWIKKKYISYYFISIFILFILSVILVQTNLIKEGKILYTISIVIRYSVVIIYWLYLGKEIIPAFLLESIEINFNQKELLFKSHKKNYDLDFHKIKDIIVNKNSEEKSKEIYGLKIIDFDDKEYLFGFALSRDKSREVREILLKALEREIL